MIASKTRQQEKFQVETVINVNQKKRSKPIEIADLGGRCFSFDLRMGIGSASEIVKVTMWDPCTTDATKSGAEPGINDKLRQKYLTDQVYHGVIVTFDLTDTTSFKKAIM